MFVFVFVFSNVFECFECFALLFTVIYICIECMYDFIAYRYATTGSWSSGRSKPGSNANNSSQSNYRPSIQSRYPNRRRGGG